MSRRRSRARDWGLFALGLALLAFLLLVVMPWLTRHGPLARTLQHNQAQDFNVGAYFYTEL